MRQKDVLSELGEIRRAFDQFFVSGNPMMSMSDPYWRPPMDVFDTPECTLVRLEIAGMNKEDIEIGLDGDRLIISGRRQSKNEDNPPPRCYRQMEIKYANFRREVLLLQPFVEKGIQATYSNGFLEIKVPTRIREAKSTRIKIDVQQES